MRRPSTVKTRPTTHLIPCPDHHEERKRTHDRHLRLHRQDRVRHRRQRLDRRSNRARAFAEVGASVAILDRDGDAAQRLTDELAAAGRRALAIACDVADENQVARAVTTTVEAFGSLDMAFNNAGIMVPLAPHSQGRLQPAAPGPLRAPLDRVALRGAVLARPELADADTPMADGVLARMLTIRACPLCGAVRHAVGRMACTEPGAVARWLWYAAP